MKERNVLRMSAPYKKEKENIATHVMVGNERVIHVIRMYLEIISIT